MNREELLFAVRALDRSHDGADRAGERVVKQRGDEYAEDDRPGPFVARGQQQGGSTVKGLARFGSRLRHAVRQVS